MDDCLRSMETEEALHVVKGTREVLGKAGFNLTKFVASSVEILSEIPEELRAKEVKNLDDQCSSKVLGVRWNVNGDEFYFDINEPELSGEVTKRSMLKVVASMYDPLGLVSPITVMGKMLFQEAAKLKSWDEVVSSELAERWLMWIASLKSLVSLKIPRCVKPNQFDDAMLELHCFSDASLSAYGSCCYVRCVNKPGFLTMFHFKRDLRVEWLRSRP